MKHKAEISAFFTDLDAILDTRMGTLLRIDPDCPERVIKGGYFTRDRNVFPGIDTKVFEETYKNRDKITLRGSVMTATVESIEVFCRNTYENNIHTPFIREPKIIINTYPYKLNEEETELIKTVIELKTKKITKIELVNMSPSEITPSYLKREISIISIYDPYEWLETHSASGLLKRETCPGILMTGPMIFRNAEFNETDIKQFKTYIEMLAKPFIDLTLLPIHLFSLDLFPKKKKPTETSE